MACNLFRLIPSVSFSKNFVSMEHFKSERLEDKCSQKLGSLRPLNEDTVDTPLSEYCSIHQQLTLSVYCKQCGVDICRGCTINPAHRKHDHIASNSAEKISEETRRLGEAADGVVELMEEMKRAISGVNKMKQRVRDRKDKNINATREVFATLRKAIDEREEQTITDIKEEAYKREKALESQLERLVLLWTQLKNCLQLMKSTNIRAEKITKRRMMLEQQRDHLKETKKKSILEPVMSEQAEPEFKKIEQWCQIVNKLGYIPLDPSKCKAVIPPMIVKKMTTLMIMLKDKNNNTVTDASKELNVLIENTSGGEAIQIITIKERGGGRYEASFTPDRCGYYMISIIVDGHHIPGSPHRTPVDGDYNKMTEQDSSQVVTHYGGNKFGSLCDVAIAPTGEIVMIDYDNRCVIVLDDKFNVLKMIGRNNSRLITPGAIAVTDGIIAVSHQGGNSPQVQKYSLQGDFQSVVACHDSKNGQFKPRGLAFNNNKLLYVVDGGNHRIQAFNQDDTFAFSFGSKGKNPGQFQRPVKIAIDLNNNVLVTDRDSKYINIFTHDGQFIQRINSDKPFAITISPTGYLMISHRGDDNKIKILSPTYQLIKEFGKRGSKQGEFDGIAGMAMDSSGTVYVAEYENKRLQVINKS